MPGDYVGRQPFMLQTFQGLIAGTPRICYTLPPAWMAAVLNLPPTSSSAALGSLDTTYRHYTALSLAGNYISHKAMRPMIPTRDVHSLRSLTRRLPSENLLISLLPHFCYMPWTSDTSAASLTATTLPFFCNSRS